MSTWDSLLLFWQTQWDVHPERSAVLIALGLLYAAGITRVGRDRGGSAWGQSGWFLAGLLALALAVQSPLHHLADRYLFSAHMVQHLLLTLVVPPLLLLGTPAWLVGPWLQFPWLTKFGHTAAYPAAAFFSFNLFFAYIHLPTIYDAVFGNEVSHAWSHAALLITGVATWMPIASPIPEVLPRLPLPGRMLYCFLQTIPGSLVGSMITLADQVLYRHYSTAALELGVDPLADQQLGGLFMWVVAGSYFLVLLTVLFFIWADREERRG